MFRTDDQHTETSSIHAERYLAIHGSHGRKRARKDSHRVCVIPEGPKEPFRVRMRNAVVHHFMLKVRVLGSCR